MDGPMNVTFTHTVTTAVHTIFSPNILYTLAEPGLSGVYTNYTSESDEGGIRDRSPSATKNLFLLHRFQTGSGTHLATQ